MPSPKQSMFWFRFISIVAVVCLFVADFGFGVMAKSVPVWAYGVPGLLALGIEATAVGRLLMQIARAVARVPPEKEGDQ